MIMIIITRQKNQKALKVYSVFVVESQEPKDNTWYSIFPIENQELIYGNWEDDIIWDAEVC